MNTCHAPVERTAYFRFYEELNDFLPKALRKVSFPYVFSGRSSVKDSIEAMGVPHTEIDLILVDGVSVGFDHPMQGGERVSVYPVFEALDITPLIHLRPKPLREPRFVVDVNLGKLAQNLRLLGFDTLFDNHLVDSAITDISLREHRIILTRDRGLLKRGAVTHGYWVRETDPLMQVREVVRRLQLENGFHPFTRCSVCNGRICPVDKARVWDRIPAETCRVFDEFWACGGCGKVYWQGAHYRSIREFVVGLIHG